MAPFPGRSFFPVSRVSAIPNGSEYVRYGPCLVADRADLADWISDQYPTGRYLAKVVTGGRTIVDRAFDPLDSTLYALIGRRICTQAMDWKSYTLHMLATNLVMAILIFLILVFQDLLGSTGFDPNRNRACPSR